MSQVEKEITQPNVGFVDSIEQLDLLLEKVSEAQTKFQTLRQDTVNKIFKECAMIANDNRVKLAAIAVNEAHMGTIEDKTIKNHFASETVYNAYKDTKTCGIVEKDLINGYSLFAEPVGILAGIIPCTNPTSTTIFKALISLKTRNCIVFSPHPRTVKCTIATAKLIRDAAIKAGAPENCISWIDQASIQLCTILMQHPKVAMIVATGAGGLIKSAYSSGKPCMGGSSGNTPVIIDETADIPLSVNSILLSKTFDNGMICASEQAIVSVESIADKVRQEFIKRGGHFLKDFEEQTKLAQVIFNENGSLKPEAVGQSAEKLLNMAGITKPSKSTRVILAELQDVGPHVALSREKLCPCLGFYTVKNYDEALDLALRLVRFGGMGHTSVLYTDLEGHEREERISKFGYKMPTGRALLCMPTSQGAIGGLYNQKQAPSMSLGCGSWGGNSSSEGLQPKHLLNFKQVAERRDVPETFSVPPTVLFGRGLIDDSLKLLKEDKQHNLAGVKHVGILLEPYKAQNGEAIKPEKLVNVFEQITRIIWGLQIPVTIIPEHLILESPSPYFLHSSTISKISEYIKKKKIDALIAVGGTLALDAGKLVRLAVETDTTINWDQLGLRFMSISQRIIKFPSVGTKIKKLFCIPTTSGSGAEMSPFALLVNDSSEDNPKKVLTIMDISLLPDVAIVDYDISKSMPKNIALETICSAISNALESLVSLISTEYTRSLSEEALQICLDNAVQSVVHGDPQARSECHRGASISGMASANAYLGICEAMAHQLSHQLNIPNGLAKMILLPHVIVFNAEDAPQKLAAYPQYEKPKAKAQYAQAVLTAKFAKEDCCSAEDLVQVLISKLKQLQNDLEIPASIKDYGVNEKQFLEQVDQMALDAFDDQFTGSNPRYPLVTEITQLYIDSFYGKH